MKVVVASLPAYGHLYPMMPLALALERAGHQVLVASGDGFGGDLPFRRIPGAVAEWTMTDSTARVHEALKAVGRPPDEEVAVTLFLRECAPHVVDVMREQLRRERPDLVVLEQTNVGAVMAAHELGCRVAVFGVVGWGSRWSEVYRATAEVVGTRAEDLATVFIDSHPLFLADAQARPPFPSLSIRPTTWAPDDGDVPTWLLKKRTRPRAYVTLGTVFGQAGLLAATATEVAEAGCEVLAVTGPDVDAADLGELPDSVHVERFVPQARVLPLVDVVVHHGGTGTVIGSLEHALPQVVLPQGADQFWNADHLAAQGASRSVLPGSPAGSVTQAVAAVMEPDAPERLEAAWLGAVVAAMPSPDEVVQRLAR